MCAILADHRILFHQGRVEASYLNHKSMVARLATVPFNDGHERQTFNGFGDGGAARSWPNEGL